MKNAFIIHATSKYIEFLTEPIPLGTGDKELSKVLDLTSPVWGSRGKVRQSMSAGDKTKKKNKAGPKSSIMVGRQGGDAILYSVVRVGLSNRV
jgi:hypothetical protein